jgi:phage terminase Nu1 subunit (DNA packaging protein)
MTATPPRGELVTRERMAALLGVARTTLDDWVRRGCPVHKASPRKGVPSQYDTAAVLEWRVSAAAAEADPQNIDKAKEEARLAKERADSVALDNKRKRGELLPAGEVIEVWQAAIGRARSLLLGMPSAACDELVIVAARGPQAVRMLLEDRMHEALTELASSHDSTEHGDEPAEPGDDGGAGEGLVAVDAAAEAQSL